MCCVGDVHNNNVERCIAYPSNAELRPILTPPIYVEPREWSKDEELELVLFVVLRKRQGKSVVSAHVTVTSNIQHLDWSDVTQAALEENLSLFEHCVALLHSIALRSSMQHVRNIMLQRNATQYIIIVNRPLLPCMNKIISKNF